MKETGDPKAAKAQGQATMLVQGGRRKDWTGAAVNPPIWRASTFLYDDTDALHKGDLTNADGHFFYGRRGSPTQWALADAITALEPGAAGTMLFPSGVAAVSLAMLSVLKPGDHVLMVDCAYDPTRNFCNGFLANWGIETSYYDPCIGGGIEALCRNDTALIFLESPGSHSFEVQDVPAIVAVAKARGIVTIIDNTWATPLLLTSFDKGVDISICVGTKYLGGHSDVMMGAVTANAETWPKLRKTAQAMGQTISPDDAYLVSRGMRTLGVRLARCGETALAVAHWLEAHPKVARVLHPALPSFRGHDIWRRDFKGASGLFGFILNGGTSKDRDALIDALLLFGIGFSWGGYESLAVPSDIKRLRTAVPWQAEGPMIRLSIGLEDPADLIRDLEAALEKYPQAT